MNNSEEIKKVLNPLQVVQFYLGQPVKKSSLGYWYKSPFRNERTASFLVNNEKGIHDFGSSIHYDIISFIQDYFKVDFKKAMKILNEDFNLPKDEEIDRELKEYLIKRKKEQKQAEYILNTWYNKRFGEICDEIHNIKNAIPYLRGEALAIAYDQEVKLQILAETFMNATDDQKIELFREWRTKENGIK